MAVNDRFAEATNYEQNELLVQTLFSFSKPEEVVEVVDLIRLLLTGAISETSTGGLYRYDSNLVVDGFGKPDIFGAGKRLRLTIRLSCLSREEPSRSSHISVFPLLDTSPLHMANDSSVEPL